MKHTDIEKIKYFYSSHISRCIETALITHRFICYIIYQYVLHNFMKSTYHLRYISPLSYACIFYINHI